jgi:hypothetical protein
MLWPDQQQLQKHKKSAISNANHKNAEILASKISALYARNNCTNLHLNKCNK